MKKKGETEKAFNNWQHNRVHFTFPNGNSISIIWGAGSYSENHDRALESGIDAYGEFMQSNDAEIMVLNAPDKLYKNIYRKFGDGDNSVIGYLDIVQVLEIMNLLAKPPRRLSGIKKSPKRRTKKR